MGEDCDLGIEWMGAGLSLTLSSSSSDQPSELEDSFVGLEPTLPTPSLPPSLLPSRVPVEQKRILPTKEVSPCWQRAAEGERGYLTFVASENRFVREILF